MAEPIFSSPNTGAQLPPNLRPVTPHFSRRGEFVPEVGKNVTVDLGGETIRCEILEILSHDVIVVCVGTRDPQTGKIVGVVIDKTGHGIKAGSNIAVQRSTDNPLGIETWRPVNDREVREQEAIDRARAQVAAQVPTQVAPAERIEMPPPAIAQAVPPSEVPVTAVPHGTTGPDAEPPRKVLGPRRSKVKHAEVEPTHRRVLGPRRSKIAKRAS